MCLIRESWNIVLKETIVNCFGKSYENALLGDKLKSYMLKMKSLNVIYVMKK